MASEPKMTDQDNRDLGEAVGWKYRDKLGCIMADGETWRNPFGNNGDAIAALEAWRAKHGGSVFITLSKPHKVDIFNDGRFIGNCNGDTLPLAACRAILAAWRKMKESE